MTPFDGVISPVSGGTLGSLVFVNLLDIGTPREKLVAEAERILSGDFLAPAMGSLFFKDVPSWFIPLPFLNDRAADLEVAWERGWLRNKESSACSGPFARKFSVLQAKEKSAELPTLLINGTSVFTGERILTTHLSVSDFKGCTPAFDHLDVSMSTAAMMSARFSYVSPAGTLVKEGKEKARMKVVDGGYYDNSGASTGLEFLTLLEKLPEKVFLFSFRSTTTTKAGQT